jgi:5'-methylthioadenosine phosphorylase
MEKIAIIGGSGFQDYKNTNVFFIKRHKNCTPPHKIDHKANLQKIKKAGITKIVGVCSVGSLKPRIVPGTLLLPDDYINLYNIDTIHHKIAVHIVPSLDHKLRELLIKSARKLKIKTINHGVYYQTRGPRFETKAEIKMISKFADVVGMTMSNEATLAQEMGLDYAAICIVDNYANGVIGALQTDTWRDAQKNNFPVIAKLINYLTE